MHCHVIVQGEILRTRGGGTSVQFTDVEVLEHSRPKMPSTSIGVRQSLRLSSRDLPSSSVEKEQVGFKSDGSLSSFSSLSESSSLERSVDEQWTDVETRVSVS